MSFPAMAPRPRGRNSGLRTKAAASSEKANDPKYLERRHKNNEAVKLCREKAKKRFQDMERKIKTLRKHNYQLEGQLISLRDHFVFIKETVKHITETDGIVESIDVLLNESNIEESREGEEAFGAEESAEAQEEDNTSSDSTCCY